MYNLVLLYLNLTSAVPEVKIPEVSIYIANVDFHELSSILNLQVAYFKKLRSSTVAEKF